MSVRGPITAGINRHYFTRMSITDTAFPNDAQVVLQFKSPVIHINLINEGGDLIEYSFNGTDVHGDLATSGLTQERTYERKQVVKVWFRAATAATVRIEAWGE